MWAWWKVSMTFVYSTEIERKPAEACVVRHGKLEVSHLALNAVKQSRVK